MVEITEEMLSASIAAFRANPVDPIMGLIEAVAPLIEAQARGKMGPGSYEHLQQCMEHWHGEAGRLRTELAQARADAIEALRVIDSYASPNHDDWFFIMRKKVAALSPRPISEKAET